jgi:ribosomal protein S10
MHSSGTDKTRLDIKLVGNDHTSTQKASQEIGDFFKANNCKLLASVKMPVKQTYIHSIRRCHFIYKESRDQFTTRRHKIIMFVEFENDKQTDLREKMKKVHIPAGVSVAMKIKVPKNQQENSPKVFKKTHSAKG